MRISRHLVLTADVLDASFAMVAHRHADVVVVAVRGQCVPLCHHALHQRVGVLVDGASHQEEGRWHAVLLQELEHLRSLAGVGTVVEGEHHFPLGPRFRRVESGWQLLTLFEAARRSGVWLRRLGLRLGRQQEPGRRDLRQPVARTDGERRRFGGDQAQLRAARPAGGHQSDHEADQRCVGFVHLAADTEIRDSRPGRAGGPSRAPVAGLGWLDSCWFRLLSRFAVRQ